MFEFLKKKIVTEEKTNNYPTNGEFVYGYKKKPSVSFIINHFVASKTLVETIKNLKRTKITNEIIVINDTGKNNNKISNNLNLSNDTVINTYNLGESNGYILGSKISRAKEFLVFIQDDDLAPENDNWLKDCLNLFNKEKKVGLIGLNGGGIRGYSKNSIVDFSRGNFFGKFYCSWLKCGPLVIKKDVYEKIGGWEMLANVGESDHFSDQNLTFKVWKNGFKSCLLLTKNTKMWKRRFNRDDGLNKEKLIKNKNRQFLWFKNRKKFLSINKKELYKLENQIIKSQKII